MEKGTFQIKTGFAEMFKGGVIMDVTTPEQAVIAEEAGAVAVMALERVPADIRAQGGVARMSDPKVIKEIMAAVSIPVMAVRHARTMWKQIRYVQSLREDELVAYAKEIGAPLELVRWVHDHGRLPVVNFAAGGIATPADAALMMHLGMDGVFVGSGIFKSGDPRKRARAIVRAVTHYNDPEVLAEVSEDLGEPMVGINLDQLKEEERLAKRGW